MHRRSDYHQWQLLNKLLNIDLLSTQALATSTPFHMDAAEELLIRNSD
jgi:hypothetical protein